jgi:hypothetical protein
MRIMISALGVSVLILGLVGARNSKPHAVCTDIPHESPPTLALGICQQWWAANKYADARILLPPVSSGTAPIVFATGSIKDVLEEYIAVSNLEGLTFIPIASIRLAQWTVKPGERPMLSVFLQ